MAVLGIEGTAHTLGVGIVEETDASLGQPRCRVLANERIMVRPEHGGIHPRDAAHHHGEFGPGVLAAALQKWGGKAEDLEAIAFSQGPGLGPCLRVAATMARSLSLSTGLPLVGVNHCVAHLEIGRGVTPADDPMLLYVSGANTQILAFARGRYRVFGETLDIGLGNALDKFARDNDIAFPGGPEIEKLAKLADPAILHPLPYSVKGMDLNLAGLATAAQRLVADGVPLPEVCHSLQETAFAQVVEVAERALAHTGKPELVLGGGVACNSRLQAMARAMCEDRGARLHAPPRDLLVDNGAMIAWLGLAKLRVGDTLDVAGSQTLPYQRTDQVEVTWRRGEPTTGAARGVQPAAANESDGVFLARQGAEAVVAAAQGFQPPALAKRREVKRYRHATLDAMLRSDRSRDEANLLCAARRAGVPVPVLFDVDRAGGELAIEQILGETLREALPTDADEIAGRRLAELGRLAARLHDAGLVHGDLTPSNVMVPDAAAPDRLVLIDFGLGSFTRESEPRGVDLHLVEEALEATESRAAPLFAAFLASYKATASDPTDALRRLDDIRERGRYR